MPSATACPRPGSAVLASVPVPALAGGPAEAVGRAAYQALVEEVSLTPKPGLVDRQSPGAHRDMDYLTFLASARALRPYFTACAARGLRHAGGSPRLLFARLRGLGLAAEAAMYRATGGVNTHKGGIFSLGILAASAGRALRDQGCARPAELFGFAAELAAGVVDGDLARLRGAGLEGRPLTKGERLYLEQDVRGIRGEAEAGFPAVRDLALPLLRRLSRRHPQDRNGVLTTVLLHLMAQVEDTNVLGRGGPEGLRHVQASAKAALALGGPFTPEGRRFIQGLDPDFTARRLSPGGSADLLAVTIFAEAVAGSKLATRTGTTAGPPGTEPVKCPFPPCFP